jgi:hypothetical protein
VAAKSAAILDRHSTRWRSRTAVGAEEWLRRGQTKEWARKQVSCQDFVITIREGRHQFSRHKKQEQSRISPSDTVVVLTVGSVMVGLLGRELRVGTATASKAGAAVPMLGGAGSDTHARLRAGGARRGAGLSSPEAAAQRLDEIDGPAGHSTTLLRLRRQAGLLGPQVRQQGLLIAVAETRRREGRGLAVENVRRECDRKTMCGRFDAMPPLTRR